MEEYPEQELPGESNADRPAHESGLSRRDLMKAAALMTGSMILMLSRCRPLDDAGTDLPGVPSDFKRFLLAKPSPTSATEQIVVAAGSQCPDLSCALWWAESQEFQFFESIDQITYLYVQDGRTELIWLD